MPSSSSTSATTATPIAASITYPATNQAGYPALSLVAPANANSSPSSLRSAVQGFFRSTATQQLPQSNVGNAVMSIEPIQNDKLLEKHSSGILKTSRISTAEIQMVVSDTYSFHKIQAILRKHQSQTNALAEHIGYDLVQERYHEVRRVQASIYNSKASAATNSPIPLRRRSLYSKLSPATPTRLVIDNTRGNNTSNATSPTNKERSRSPPQHNTSSSSWDFSPPPRKRTGTADHDELPIHAIRDSPASVREFVQMNDRTTSGRFKSAAPLEDVADDRPNVVLDD
jgi:hypothetical protein